MTKTKSTKAPEDKVETAAPPTDKVDKDAAADTVRNAAAGLPVDPQSEEVAERLGDLARTLPPNPKKALVAAYTEVARVVGVDKAKRLLAEKHGTDDPETLKASQLMDAIDDLYGAQ